MAEIDQKFLNRSQSGASGDVNSSSDRDWMKIVNADCGELKFEEYF